MPLSSSRQIVFYGCRRLLPNCDPDSDRVSLIKNGVETVSDYIVVGSAVVVVDASSAVLSAFNMCSKVDDHKPVTLRCNVPIRPCSVVTVRRKFIPIPLPMLLNPTSIVSLDGHTLSQRLRKRSLK